MRLLPLALLALLAHPAEAGPVSRLKDSWSALTGQRSTVGTVLAMAQVNQEGQQTAVLVLDTVVKMGIGCFVFDAGDLGKVHKRLEVGSTLEVFSLLPGKIDMGEISCFLVDRWDAKRKGSPDRREFLTGERGFGFHAIALALRGKPRAIERFFGPGAPSLARVASDLPALIKTFADLGYSIGPAGKPEVAQCREVLAQGLVALDSASSALAGIEASAASREVTAALLLCSSASTEASNFFNSFP